MFAHTKDAKKAAGRALGTMVELITYYLLREWGLCDYISIERGLPEFGDDEIRHNVEFTIASYFAKNERKQESPLTATKIMGLLSEDMVNPFSEKKQ